MQAYASPSPQPHQAVINEQSLKPEFRICTKYSRRKELQTELPQRGKISHDPVHDKANVAATEKKRVQVKVAECCKPPDGKVMAVCESGIIDNVGERVSDNEGLRRKKRG